MIESIYSNENGESNRTNRVQPILKMPKNIRQVGKSSATKKIYVEDYVMTYIKQLAGEDYSKCKVAVLVGQFVKNENCRNIFIYGAIEVEGIDTTNDLVFSNDVWTGIYEKIKKYFVEAEIVGWFYGGPGYLLEDKDKITKAHIDNFAGQDKTLLTYDNMEKEETFLVYENSSLTKQEGYYIYYEKNEEMQTYMIDQKKTQSEESTFDDRVSREIRTVIQNKKPQVEENKSVNRLMYAAGTLLAVIILVVGAAMLNNHDQMKNMQDALNSLSENMQEIEMIFEDDKAQPATTKIDDKDTVYVNDEIVEDSSKEPVENDASDTGEDGLDVEIIEGNVNPIDDDDDKPISEEELANEEDTSDREPQQTEDNTTQDQPNPQEDTTNDESNEQTSSDEVQEVKYYTVKAGESLLGISLKLYNSANYMTKIMKLNNITDENLIYEGQKLIVP